MPIRFACCLLLVACTGVHVDQVNVDDPTVNIDATANVDVDANANANVDVQPTDTGAVQPADTEKPVDGVKAPALVREPAPAQEPETEPAIEPEACADSDSDGVCDEADTCPAGSDADADGTGYADGCERALWTTAVWVSPSPNQRPESYEAGQPAAIVVVPNRGRDCLTDTEGSGMLAIEVPQHYTDEPLIVRVARPDSGRGGKMIECIESGITSNVLAGLSKFGSYSTPFTEVRALPEGSAGHHIVYFEVTLSEYVTLPAQPYGTLVTAFNATITARGY
jgi:hypothetical protein